MARQKRPSLTRQIEDEFKSMIAFGESKHEVKHSADFAGSFGDKIYSINTLKNYMNHANHFAKWAKEEHGCRYLDEAREHVEEYLQNRINSGKAPHTIGAEASALAKLYHCSKNDFAVNYPVRRRGGIKNNRNSKNNAVFAAKAKNAVFSDFCRSTGLRKHELEKLRVSDFRRSGDDLYVIVRQGKGGKYRESLCLDPAAVEKVLAEAHKKGKKAEDKLFGKVSSSAGVHSFRGDYAVKMYKELARDLKSLSRKEKYFCRGDLKGLVLDRKAMLEVSRNMGHERVNVIASHYLYKLKDELPEEVQKN